MQKEILKKKCSFTINESYANNVTDEFIQPIVMVDENNNPVAKIQEDDVVIFFNFRTDRGRINRSIIAKRLPRIQHAQTEFVLCYDDQLR